MMTIDENSRFNRQRHRPRRRFATLLVTVIILGTMAYFLTPTGQINSRGLVQVNGVIYSVQPTVTARDLDAISALIARDGSTLSLTGDVIALGEGGPASRQLNGAVIVGNPTLVDGSQMSVRHGDHRLETIKKVTRQISFKTRFEGNGPVITLVQAGVPGQEEIFKGSSSGKEASAFVVTPAQDAIVQCTASTKSSQKLAALTFDDGPGTYTQAVLDALAAKHVKATFFVLGGSAAGNRSMIEKIKAAGHEVENHSWDHPVLSKLTAEQIRSQISRTNAVIGGSQFLRPPYGEYDAEVTAIANSMGLRLVLWTVDTLDWKYPSVDSIMSYVKAETEPGAIILMHDGGKNRSETVAAIPAVVDWLLKNGYSLTTVDRLL